LHRNYSVFFHCNDRILHTVEKGRYRYNRLFKNRHGLEHSLGDDYTFFPSKTCVQEKAKQMIVKENHYQKKKAPAIGQG
jgi:hypothetical protein